METAPSRSRPPGDTALEEPARASSGSAAPSPAKELARGAVLFASAGAVEPYRRELLAAGAVVAEVAVTASDRGKLGDVLDDALELALRARGAAGPGITAARGRDAMLSDQLFRAVRAGASTLAVVVGPLRAIASPSGALDPDDSSTLAFFARAARERPVTLCLDEGDRAMGAYGEPTALADLLLALALAPETEAAGSDAGDDVDIQTRAASGRATTAQASRSAHRLPSERWPRRASSEPTWTGDAEPVTAPERREGREEEWRAWTLMLAEARGPQPLPALERLFCQAYVPLCNAVDLGLDDPRARRARDDFRHTFASGYLEAFPTFALTNKRPRMVFDAHDLAARAARLHGARTTRLLLVDSMRWDLSRAIQRLLVARLDGRAAIADDLVLWSALPTTTLRQLETIARGLEALRAPSPLDGECEPARGRNAEHVRRIRVGPREVHKLDIVEARVQAARGNVPGALEDIASATCEAIARHVDTLAPRTLVFVFGDHGFAIDRNGTASQGGASPEEVLVGAFALLVGDVH